MDKTPQWTFSQIRMTSGHKPPPMNAYLKIPIETLPIRLRCFPEPAFKAHS